jgi:hypothetical protein
MRFDRRNYICIRYSLEDLIVPKAKRKLRQNIGKSAVLRTNLIHTGFSFRQGAFYDERDFHLGKHIYLGTILFLFNFYFFHYLF